MQAVPVCKASIHLQDVMSKRALVMFDCWYVLQAYWALIGVMLVLGASSSVGSMGLRIGVENEMVKALCDGDSAALAKLNSGKH